MLPAPVNWVLDHWITSPSFLAILSSLHVVYLIKIVKESIVNIIIYILGAKFGNFLENFQSISIQIFYSYNLDLERYISNPNLLLFRYSTVANWLNNYLRVSSEVI